jgi:hypothetical protein
MKGLIWILCIPIYEGTCAAQMWIPDLPKSNALLAKNLLKRLHSYAALFYLVIRPEDYCSLCTIVLR